MLSIDATTLDPNSGNTVYALEFDIEHGRVQVHGETEVFYNPPQRHRGPELESAATGGCYTEPETIRDVQIWNAEEHYLAIFPDEPSLQAGGRQLAAEWGDALPHGIHRVIA